MMELMNDATLWVLFIANACAIVGLLVLAVRGWTKTDYSNFIPPTVIELPDEIDLRDDVVVPAPRVALTELHMRQPHAVSND